MKTLLALVPAPIVAAATRYRLHQFAPALHAAGVELVLRPFLDDSGFDLLYRPGHTLTKVQVAARALANRVLDLVRAVDADAVLVHREAALIGPPVWEWIASRILRRPLIFDLDDAVWVPYVSPTYGALLSRLVKMPGKTDWTLKAATEVIAGNPYVARYSGRFCPRITVIPTVVDTTVFTPSSSVNSVPVLGWIGTHSSAPYLKQVIPALRQLAQRYSFKLKLVGGEADTSGIPTEIQPWSIDREVEQFQSLDIGLYPLTDGSWSVGKSGFKAVQYMACAKAVVASPVGVTSEIVQQGKTGYLVGSDREWFEALETLICSPTLRTTMGNAGRIAAESLWSTQVHAPRFVEVVLRAMGHGRKRQ